MENNCLEYLLHFPDNVISLGGSYGDGRKLRIDRLEWKSALTERVRRKNCSKCPKNLGEFDLFYYHVLLTCIELYYIFKHECPDF